nr:DUF1572 family protein [Halobacillus sp. Marseille-Q1614]
MKTIQNRFQSVKDVGDQAIQQLAEDDIYWRLNEESNNITIIIKHLTGNMVSRWTDFLTSDGEKDYRNRDEEFEDTITSKQEMMEVWDKGWTVLFGA